MKILFRTRLKALAMAGCFCIIALFLGNSWVLAAQKDSGIALIVVMDRLRVSDLDNPGLKTIQRINREGAIALFNTGTASTRIPENTYTTIGAGVRSNGSGEAHLAFNAFEIYEHTPAAETFHRRIGENLKKEQVGHIGLAQIIKGNAHLNWNVQPGALGTALRQAGLKTAVLGNADNHLEFRRQIAAIAMDDRGIVDLGNVSAGLLVKDPTSLTGKRTDYEKLFQEFLLLREQADFIVIEMGDTARVDDGSPYALDKVVSAQRSLALEDADRFLARVLEEIDLEQDLLMVLTPTPPTAAFEGKDLMTPVMAMGKGISPGLLVSGTTKRPGIVANTDIAPTMLAFFNLDTPRVMSGRVISSVEQADPLGFILKENRDIVYTHLARPILVQGFVILQIIIIILSVLAVFWKKPSPRVMKHLLLGLAAVPLTLLLLPLLPQPRIIISVLEALALTGVLVVLCYWLGRKRDLGPFLWICLATTLFLFIDILMGSPLMKGSTLGYDPIIGARYYGLGNEYMGVYIGAPIVGLTALLTSWPPARRWSLVLVGLAFLAITFTIAAPQLGTNVGGTISALAGFGVTFYLLLRGKLSLRTLTAGILLVFLIVGGFIAFDLSRETAQQSHIGRTATMILEGNSLQAISDIVTRKLAVNFKLIKYTRWSWVFLISMGALAILFYRPIGIFKTLQQKYPGIFKGFIGVIVGSITALIFNDSGIVAAATMMVFAVATLIYLVIEERFEKQKRVIE